MTQKTFKNAPTMRFPSKNSPTHGMVQWIPNFEPIFIPIPPGGGSVPTTPEDEQTHSFQFSKPNTSTFNPNTSSTQQGNIPLSDDSNNDYDITNEEMTRACQDKTFQNNFKLLAAQEIVKFNPNLEGTKSKHQTNSTLQNVQPMINLDLEKTKQPFEF